MHSNFVDFVSRSFENETRTVSRHETVKDLELQRRNWLERKDWKVVVK